MTIKLSIRYGIECVAITEVPLGDAQVTFFAKDGDDEVAVRSFSFDEMPEAIAHQIYLYGCNKLLTDRTSDQKDKIVKLGGMQEVYDMLMEGEWAKERVVGAIVCSPEVEALAEMQKMSIPEVQAALGQYDKATRDSILGRDDVQAAAKTLREARKDRAVKTLDDMI